MRHLARALARLIYRVRGECDRCPACGSHRLFDLDLHTLRAPIDGRRTAFISGCDGCGLVFRNPPPSPDELKTFYSPAGEWGAPRIGEVDRPKATKRRGDAGGTWTSIFEPIADVMSVTNPPPGSRVLDFGCGDGRLLDLLQDCGWDTTGIETAVATAFRRHHRLDAIPDGPVFDLVIAHHVLEHVTDPLSVLRQLAAACRVGGYLLVSVPRLDTLPLHRDYKYVLNGTVHVTAYTWPCLESLFARSGWSAVAPPPARVRKGGGRTTAARLRVMARRVDGPIQSVAPPGRAARAALRHYYAGDESRPFLARAGVMRLAARRAEAKRRREVQSRKAAKRRPHETPAKAGS